jgi:hypothetical protein
MPKTPDPTKVPLTPEQVQGVAWAVMHLAQRVHNQAQASESDRTVAPPVDLGFGRCFRRVMAAYYNVDGLLRPVCKPLTLTAMECYYIAQVYDREHLIDFFEPALANRIYRAADLFRHQQQLAGMVPPRQLSRP